MSQTNSEMGVATGETAEAVYDGAHFLQQYVEVAATHQEAERLNVRAERVSSELIRKLMDPETGEPLYEHGSQVPESLAGSMAASSLIALVDRSRGHYLSHLAYEQKGAFALMYLEHYAGRRVRVTAKEELLNPIRKLGVASAGKDHRTVTGTLSSNDMDMALQFRPLLHIKGRVNWFEALVVDPMTLEPVIDIEMLD